MTSAGAILQKLGLCEDVSSLIMEYANPYFENLELVCAQLIDYCDMVEEYHHDLDMDYKMELESRAFDHGHFGYDSEGNDDDDDEERELRAQIDGQYRQEVSERGPIIKLTGTYAHITIIGQNLHYLQDHRAREKSLEYFFYEDTFEVDMYKIRMENEISAYNRLVDEAMSNCQ